MLCKCKQFVLYLLAWLNVEKQVVDNVKYSQILQLQSTHDHHTSQSTMKHNTPARLIQHTIQRDNRYTQKLTQSQQIS